MRLLCTVAVTGMSLVGCTPADSDSASAPSVCPTVAEVAGVYECAGQCATWADSVSAGAIFREIDSIRAVPDATEPLFEIAVTGGGGFQEVEVGALVGTTLRTATAAVSDSTYPVIEEYVFETDSECRAAGFTKIVRGLAAGEFKACSVSCRRAE